MSEPAEQPTENHPDRTLVAALLSTCAALVPGFVAGGSVGLLLLYLNPGSAIAGLAALRLVVAYAAVGAGSAVVLVLPFVWRNMARAARAFPWMMTVVLAIAATYFVAHASRWSFYLPAATNRRLVLIGVMLFALGLLCFYTALLHTLHRRRYSGRSLGLVTACGLAALAVAAVGRPVVEPVPAPALSPAPEVNPELPLVLVGLEGATLEVLLPMVEQGSLPQMGSWIDEGAVAPVSTLKPPRRVALWTSLATGSWPFHHRAHGERIYRAPWLGEGYELRLLPEWLWFERWGLFGSPGRPTRTDDLARKPFWQVFRDLGLLASVDAWPASAGEDQPAALHQPAAAADAVVVMLDELAAASQDYFGAWVRVRRGNLDPDLERDAEQLEAAYRQVDRQLAAWQATLPDERITAVVSAHGYGTAPNWRRLIAELGGRSPGRGTARGGQDGVLILHGPGIRSGERLPAVRLVDVMPTLMHAAGLPVAADDLDGEVVTAAFAPEGLVNRPLTFVPSYEAWASRP